jgi:hypothetical protein
MSDVNYTFEQGKALKDAYAGATTQDERVAVVEAFAVDFGKSTRSIIAKLVREGVYLAKEKAAKAEKQVRKADLVAMIEAKLEVELPSLEKAGRLDLMKLVYSLEALAD